MQAQLKCIRGACGATYSIDDVLYTCPRCGGLLEASYPGLSLDPAHWKKLWRERRLSNAPLDQSGVWRYRELLPFLDFQSDTVATLHEGNTPLLPAQEAARYAGMQALVFKHQGYNPTGSFKDNGMTCGASQALHLGMARVACVSTGNTSASMAAYAAVSGMTAIIFLPHGNISFGKLAQALEYGALTLQVEANFDQILALVRVLAERTGLYLLNSMNPFRLEGQKTIMVEMLDQRDWLVPDWVIVPGGNLAMFPLSARDCANCWPWALLTGCRNWRWSRRTARPRSTTIFTLRSAGNFGRCRIRRLWLPPSGLAIPCHGPRRYSRLRHRAAPSSELLSRRSRTLKRSSDAAESAASLPLPPPSPDSRNW